LYDGLPDGEYSWQFRDMFNFLCTAYHTWQKLQIDSSGRAFYYCDYYEG